MHLMHKICYNQYIDAGFKTCPICQKSIADLTHYWTSIDSFIQNNPIPSFFQQYRVQVMCRDCNKVHKFEIKIFNVNEFKIFFKK